MSTEAAPEASITYSAEQVQNDVKQTTGQSVDVPPGRYRSLFSALFGKAMVTQKDLPNTDPRFVERLNNFLLTQRVRTPAAATGAGITFDDPASDEDETTQESDDAQSGD